jgi:hypothetical protein
MAQPQKFQLIQKPIPPLEGDFSFREFFHFANRKDFLPAGGERVRTSAPFDWKSKPKQIPPVT